MKLSYGGNWLLGYYGLFLFAMWAFFFRRMTLTIPRFLQPHLCVL